MKNFRSSYLPLFVWMLTVFASAKTAEDLILEDPVREYAKYSARLRKEGANASFPEFAPVIEHLKKQLQSAEFLKRIAEHPALELELKEVLTLLFHVNLDFTFDNKEAYPYDRPFPGPYPYRPTIDAIENALRLFDKVERLNNPKAVPLYHFDRYAYHRHVLLADPDVVIFPTLRPLGFQDLIRVRSVPLGFVGVVTETTRVDRHWQSPLDFWYHDLNHIRRMCAYLALRAKVKGAKGVRAKLKFYREMDRFIVETILPNIEKLPAGSGPEEVALRRLVRVIIFEIIHETALTAERDTLLADILRAPNTPQPFEHMMPQAGFEAAEIEKLRTGTGNLQSGATIASRRDSIGMPTVIRYFHDRALSLLANVYNKMNYGFFDDPEDPKAYVVPVEYRRAEFVVKAAERILGILKYPHPPSSEELREVVLSKKGAEEKFVYKRLFEHEGDKGREPEATEPIGADEAITQIKERARGKKIYSLFGFSKRDYQDKRKAMQKIRQELQVLDPQKTLIAIGATEEGIGAAYEIAHELGFDTIGVVSTKSLTYAGKFSRFVNKIFIINDDRWGGYTSSGELTPVTRVFVEASDVISAHGGDRNTAVALKEAGAQGKKVLFTEAEMNHSKALAAAEKNNQPPPENFMGSAYEMWNQISSKSAGFECEKKLTP